MKKLPPLPKTVPSQLGPVPVLIVEQLSTKAGSDDCLGVWDPIARSISLRSDCPLAVQWQALYHEVVHMVLWDSGLRLGEALEEQVCDLVGSYLVSTKLAPL